MPEAEAEKADHDGSAFASAAAKQLCEPIIFVLNNRDLAVALNENAPQPTSKSDQQSMDMTRED